MVELACGVCAVLLRVRVLLGRVCLVVMLGTVCRPGDARDMVLVPIWPYELLGSPLLKVLRIRHQIVMIVMAVIAICMMTEVAIEQLAITPVGHVGLLVVYA